jgi:hypothetical protein
MHLNAEELVDIAEGTRPESAAPHLASCEPCRAQLRELRAMMSIAQDAEVPEPSPLFWDHLSARVRGAVAAEGLPRRPFWGWPRLAVPVAVAAMAGLILAVALSTGRITTPAPAALPQTVSFASIDLLSDPQSTDDDTALTMVAELSSDLDFDAAREAGLAVRGSAEHAVTHLNGGELRELQRLLQEELARSGA